MSCRSAVLLLLAVGRLVALAIDSYTMSLEEPTIKSCVFLEHANVTCYWEPAANASFNVSYILRVNVTSSRRDVFGPQYHCRTMQTHCSVQIISVMHYYSMEVEGWLGGSMVSSPRRFTHGLKEVKLYPPVFTKLMAVTGKPECLKLFWEKPRRFGLSRDDVKKALLLFEIEKIEIGSPGKLEALVVEKIVSAFTMEVCDLAPGTNYTIRMRCKIINESGPWSDWSAALTSTTTEAVPSTAPLIWRFVESDKVTLTWKPLAPRQMNGRVLRYNVLCRQKAGQGQCGLGQCGEMLPASRLWCQLPIPPQACSCSVSATNSAGTSPQANISIPAAAATSISGSPLPRISSLHWIPLGDHRLGVHWTVEGIETDVGGFVVQWSSMSTPTPEKPHWERLNASARELVITDGVEPEVPCNVSVQALYWGEAGQELSSVAFTRQGVPSAGPTLTDPVLGEGSVTLHWSHPNLAQLRGFLMNYTLIYTNSSGPSKRMAVSRNETQMTLRGLRGKYNMCLEATTLGGSAAGPCIIVFIAGGSVGVAMLILQGALFPVAFVTILLITMKLGVRIQRRLWHRVPDPSKSSLSSWSPLHGQQNEPWSLRLEEHFNPVYEFTFHNLSDNQTVYHQVKAVDQSLLSTDLCNHIVDYQPLSTDHRNNTVNESPFSMNLCNYTYDQLPITTEVNYRPVQCNTQTSYLIVQQYDIIHRSSATSDTESSLSG